ncbi:CotH kinase family protein [Arthrobacter sp. NPDC097144]|uniref:CotH kinase family protein n=1 Tax=Arthrobacter sp. NPDC097144 TaxID=3363946 RepID=UPI003808A99F
MTAVSLAAAVGLAGCSTPGTDAAGVSSADTAASESLPFFDDSTVHDVSVSFSDEEYQAMLAAYSDSGDKDWISASVTIDGTTLENVGLRLKGNSSLMSLSGRGTGGTAQQAVPDAEADAEPGADTETTTDPYGTQESGDGDGTAESPQSLPWLIRLDKFVDGQQYQGRTDLVVRGNNSESSLNEALALELTGASNLATLQASAARFSVNGSAGQLRLIIESPDDELWNEDTFGSEGSIYKAESGGDYSYRGDNPDEYQDVFEEKAGEEGLEPLVEFLDFVNNSTNEEFSAHLGEHLDVDAFATYLAAQDLMGNMDDIDGPGNNSYLRYDPDTGKMTVVTWDLNLAFGAMAGGAGGPGGTGEAAMPGGLQRPDGMTRPNGMTPPDGTQLPADGTMPEDAGMPGAAGGPGGTGGTDNPLSSRFLADSGFKALVEEKTATLRADLYTSGTAQQILDKWTSLLTSQAGDLVPAETVEAEADNIAAFFTPADPASS